MDRFIKWFDRDVSELVSGTVLAFVLRGIGAILALGLNFVIGRTLGVDEAGLFFTALAIVLNFSILARLGLDNALLRLVSAAIARNIWGEANGFVWLGLRAALLVALVNTLILLAISQFLAQHLFADPALASLLWVMALGIPGFTAMMLWAAVLKAMRRVRDALVVSGVIYPLVALVLIWPLTQSFGVLGAGFAYVLGTLSAALMGWWRWKMHRSSIRVDLSVISALRRSALPLLPMNLMNQGVLPTAPLLLLGMWAPADAAGLYGAAARIALLVSFFLMSINTVVGPRFSALYVKGEHKKLVREVRRSQILVFGLSSPIILVLLLQSDWVMSFFGPGFSDGAIALTILACGQAVNAATGSVNLLLMMTGHEKDARTTSFVGAIVVLITGLALIPSLGLVGAAAANALAITAINLTSLWFVWQRLQFIALPFVGCASIKGDT